MRRTCALLISLPLCILAACSKKDPPAPSTSAASAPTAAAVTSAAASASPAAAAAANAAPGACKLEVQPFVIDKAARGETGVTLTRLPDDRIAVGYATGDGAPRVAIVALDGSASVVEVDASKLPELAGRMAGKGTRTVHRVTPLIAKDLKVRVAVDFTETRADGTRLVRCGVADEEPLARFEGRSAFDGAEDAGTAASADELRDCRTFAEGGSAWTLAFEAHDDAGAVDARWIARATGGDAAGALLEHKAVPAEAGRAHLRAAQLDRYGYTLLASAKLGDAGYVAASRYNGRIVLAKRSANWSAAGEAGDFWLGAAIGMPSLAARDGKVVVLAPIAGKLDLYGASFPVEAKVPKPEKVTLTEPAGAAVAPEGSERTAVSAAIAPHGRVFAAFLEGKAGKRRPRVAQLTEGLQPIGAVFEPLGADTNALDVKALALDDDRVLITALVTRAGAPATVEASIVRCTATP